MGQAKDIAIEKSMDPSLIFNFFFILTLEKSTDITDTTQLIILIRGIDYNFNVT